MAYPNFENKHLQKALFSPMDYISAVYRSKQKLPEKWILIFNKDLEKQIVRKYNLKKQRGHSLWGNVYIHGNIGFIRFGGVGSPHAVSVIEEIIVLGGKEFIIIGEAGGLDNIGVFLCDRAIRDEGTSHHYVRDEKYAYPSKLLMQRLEKTMKNMKIDFEKATTWTIDAPYRETKAEADHYRNEGVKTVEMEASALFSVAKIRKVKIASAFVVSDVLGADKWNPHYDKKQMQARLAKLIDASVECLSCGK